MEKARLEYHKIQHEGFYFKTKLPTLLKGLGHAIFNWLSHNPLVTKSWPHINQGWFLSIINDTFKQIAINLIKVGRTFFKFIQMQSTSIFPIITHLWLLLAFLCFFFWVFSTFLICYFDICLYSMTNRALLKLPCHLAPLISTTKQLSFPPFQLCWNYSVTTQQQIHCGWVTWRVEWREKSGYKYLGR